MLWCIVFFLLELTLSVCVFENDHVTPYTGRCWCRWVHGYL